MRHGMTLFSGTVAVACLGAATLAVAAVPLQQPQRIITAMIINAASTQEAVDRGDEALRAAWRDNRAIATRLTQALRGKSLSEAGRRKAEAQLAAVRAEQEAMRAQLEALDREYAASIRAFREGMTGLLATNDPRITESLQRYADGDSSALDDLQDYVRIVRRARQAGLDARSAAEQRGVAEAKMDDKGKGKRTTIEVLATWEEAAALDPADFWQWTYIARLRDEAGDLAGATQAARSAREKARSERETAVALGGIGNLATKQGKLAEAGAAYEESLTIARALLAANPGSTEARRDVSISLDRIGNVAVAQGKLAEAAAAYGESLTMRRALLTANPSSAEARRDVSISLDRIGKIAVVQGKLTEAAPAYGESLTMRRALLSTNPSSAEARRAVSVSLDQIGDVMVAQGKLTEAAAAYEESLTIRRALLTTNPSSAEARRDVIVSLKKLGESTGDKVYWKEALMIATRMKADGSLAPQDAQFFEYLRSHVLR